MPRFYQKLGQHLGRRTLAPHQTLPKSTRKLRALVVSVAQIKEFAFSQSDHPLDLWATTADRPLQTQLSNRTGSRGEHRPSAGLIPGELG